MTKQKKAEAHEKLNAFARKWLPEFLARPEKNALTNSNIKATLDASEKNHA